MWSASGVLTTMPSSDSTPLLRSKSTTLGPSSGLPASMRWRHPGSPTGTLGKQFQLRAGGADQRQQHEQDEWRDHLHSVPVGPSGLTQVAHTDGTSGSFSGVLLIAIICEHLWGYRLS